MNAQRAMQELDYGFALSVKSIIEAMGMYAENQHRIHRGEALAYRERDFRQIIEENGIHHNAILARWQEL